MRRFNYSVSYVRSDSERYSINLHDCTSNRLGGFIHWILNHPSESDYVSGLEVSLCDYHPSEDYIIDPNF